MLVDDIKFAHQLTLGRLSGLSGWTQYNHKGPQKWKRGNESERQRRRWDKKAEVRGIDRLHGHCWLWKCRRPSELLNSSLTGSNYFPCLSNHLPSPDRFSSLLLPSSWFHLTSSRVHWSLHCLSTKLPPSLAPLHFIQRVPPFPLLPNQVSTSQCPQGPRHSEDPT